MRSWLGLGLVLLAVPAAAQPYDLSWYTVDGGGATFSVGGTYSLGGTIGQPDASGALTGGSYALVGGFWAQPAVAPEESVDLTLTLSDAPDPVSGNQTLTYTLAVSNGGPDTASLVTLVQNLPAGVSLQSSRPPGGRAARPRVSSPARAPTSQWAPPPMCWCRSRRLQAAARS